jgi:glutamine amidotransferase
LIVVVDFGTGNSGSVVNMIKKAGGEAVVSSDPAVVLAASKLVLPGVGAFDHGMKNLRSRGLVEPLTRKAREGKTPLLGICLGFQLLSRGSEEGTLPGLGWLDADTVRFRPGEGASIKVPHMGWNTLSLRRESPLLGLLPPEARFYFVHSYHVVCRNEEDVLAVTRHGIDFVSAARRGNIFGTQFHPEKSHRYGLQVMRNFVERA